ncbi:MAG: pilus assembly protein PilM [Nitrospiraceae bacterium]|nr:pilus assembly protein PilM [Nitrospiraceae bacterium]
MSRKTNHISILQFDNRCISRLRVRRSTRGVEVLAFDQERGSWPTEEALSDALRAFTEAHGLAEDQVYTVLPRHEITARIVKLPSQDPGELEGMVRLSAEEYVPYPAEELVIDLHVLQKMPGGESKVLAVFAHHDVVDAHVELLKEAHIEPEEIFLSTACLASASMAVHTGKVQRHALVNLASGGLEVIVINGQQLEYGRAVGSGQDWALAGDQADDAIEELRVEIGASLSAYRRESEDGEGVDHVYLCSPSVDVTPHAETLTHELAAECTPAAFTNTVITRGSDAVTNLPAVLLGAALVAQERGTVRICLLPESLKAARMQRGAKRTALLFAGLAAALLLALGLLYAVSVHQRQAYIDYLRGRVAAVQPRAEGIVSKQRQLRILEQQVQRDGGVVRLLASLCSLYPESGMNITRFVFTRDEGIEVYGRAKSLKEIELFAEDVGQAGIEAFSKAERSYENRTRERNATVFDYCILLPFPSDEDEQGEGGGA